MSLLSLKSVTKRFGGLTAVNGISFDLVAGETVGLLGPNGSGKTTALDAATSALNRNGYRIVGASTSGQAARNLGAEAHIESRTITSLLWRLDRRQITLDQRSVVILDEAAMTADRDLHRVVAHVEQAQAKLVLVGDPRQISAIGPGGALAALLERHPEILTTLDINVRQRDPAERRALAELVVRANAGDPYAAAVGTGTSANGVASARDSGVEHGRASATVLHG